MFKAKNELLNFYRSSTEHKSFK